MVPVVAPGRVRAATALPAQRQRAWRDVALAVTPLNRVARPLNFGHRLRIGRLRVNPGLARALRKLNPELAAGFGLGVATVYRYVSEAVEMLAGLAGCPTAALLRAQPGDLLILDGTLIHTDRLPDSTPASTSTTASTCSRSPTTAATRPGRPRRCRAAPTS